MSNRGRSVRMKNLYPNDRQNDALGRVRGNDAHGMRSVTDVPAPSQAGLQSISATLQAMAQRTVPVVTPKRQVSVVTMPTDDEDGELKLPATWYQGNTAPAAAEGLSPERHALLIRIVAATSLALVFGLVAWLGAGGNTAIAPSPMQAASVPTEPIRMTFGQFASGWAPETPVQPSTDSASASQASIPTAQILAVSERFVATGDILAARAMLEERAGAGEPRALFALAETYDPNLLASRNAGFAEPNRTYARFLYEAARRGGVAEAQTRIDALR
jgi:hypothetical protein